MKLKKLCNEIILEGLEMLSMAMGIVSHIENDGYEIVSVTSSTNAFVAGETFNLRDTYCREVVSTGKTLAMTDIDGIAGLCAHPLYIGLPLEAYISSPIFFNRTVWGTLNFSSMIIKSKPFSDKEIIFTELSAARISTLLESEGNIKDKL